jgi:histidinol-phosphatase
MPDFNDDLRLAHILADAADAATMERFKALDLKVETKPDMTPVSEADKRAEELIRGQLGRARPRDAVLGEEYGVEGTGPRRWIIDPIDGTALFVDGDDRWLVLLGLEEDGKMVVGVAAHPAQGSVWWAVRGGGAFEGRIVGGRVVAETPIHVDASGPDTIEGSRFAAVPETWRPHLIEPIKRVTPTSPWAIHPGLLVARGDLDLAIQTGGQIWDFAATSLIVTEAGGSFSGLSGRLRPGPGASLYARSDALRLAALDALADARHAASN